MYLINWWWVHLRYHFPLEDLNQEIGVGLSYRFFMRINLALTKVIMELKRKGLGTKSESVFDLMEQKVKPRKV